MKFSPADRCWNLVRAGGSPDPTAWRQRTSAFASMVREVGSAVLITSRTEAGLSHHVFMPEAAGSEQAVLHLAQGLSAISEPVEYADLPLFATEEIGHLRASPSVAHRDSQMGVDPAELVRRLAIALRPGSWVAVTCRRPSNTEVRRVRRWYEHRLGGQLPTHHSTDDQPLIVSVWAGGATIDEVRAVLTQTAASMPGFDVEINPTRWSDRAMVARRLTLALLPAIVLGLWLSTLTSPVLAGIAGAVLFAAIAAVMLSRGITSIRDEVQEARLPVPPKRLLPPKSPRRESTNRDGRVTHARDGDYPLSSSSFLMSSTVFAGLVAPHAGAESGAASSATVSAPPVLLERIGPSIGYVGGDETVSLHIEAANGHQGLAVVGVPGSGKSALMRGIYGWHCLERVAPTGAKGWPGKTNAMIAFESKGDGAIEYQRWANQTGDRALLIEATDPSTYAIDLFAVPGTAVQRATHFVNAMQYAFDQGAIQDRSHETLVAVISAGLCIDQKVLDLTDIGLTTNDSPLAFAHTLLGGSGDEAGVQLGAALIMEARKRGDDETGIAEAARRLSPMYGQSVTAGQRRQLTEAPRNKLSALVSIEQWWSPSRRKVTWDRVLEEHRSVIVNTGVSTKGQTIDERSTELLSAMLLYGLRESMMRLCSGWQATDRYTTIFADELALIAGSSAEVISWMRNQGRSFGVRPMFATQYPEQLPREVQDAFLSFGTLMCFAQGNAQVAAKIAQDLALGGGDWTAADVAGLGKYEAAVRTTFDQQRQPTTVVKVPYWEADRESFAAAQGWART